jgi:DNA repair protein RecN (Recombination protein N)
VLIVTHLPQVAAFADRHVVVEKSDDGRVTTSGLRVVADADRVRELARMLAGLEGSESAAAHAQELLDLAASDRATSIDTPSTATPTSITRESTTTVSTPRRRKARP